VSQIQKHECNTKDFRGGSVVDLEGVPGVPWKPPFKDKLVPKEVCFVWRSLTLNAKAEKRACL